MSVYLLGLLTLISREMGITVTYGTVVINKNLL